MKTTSCILAHFLSLVACNLEIVACMQTVFIFFYFCWNGFFRQFVLVGNVIQIILLKEWTIQNLQQSSMIQPPFTPTTKSVCIHFMGF
jgi:hypothetical protein